MATDMMQKVFVLSKTPDNTAKQAENLKSYPQIPTETVEREGGFSVITWKFSKYKREDNNFLVILARVVLDLAFVGIYSSPSTLTEFFIQWRTQFV